MKYAHVYSTQDRKRLDVVRLELAHYAAKYGICATARSYHTSRNAVVVGIEDIRSTML